ncbi:putative restriction endonuclease [Streptomyces sp. 3211.6]|uniref:Uma2 family endonuclease n=1 Tax=Streptomyces sp. 3211.6 TaxID=1938845 RepID=UPI000EB2222A|nr:Uma2 family endonuclease [Streptomyces sp. 3211.6]RKT05611.1 putative restriction endonuclease [Streptomyces sp. 3211.6]
MATAAESGDYTQGVDPELALKYAIQHMQGDRVEIVEGVIQGGSGEVRTPTWDHERAAERIRYQITERVRELGCITGSGNLDCPRSPNWYVPDLTVVPEELAAGAAALVPDQTLLIVEVTSETNAETDRIVKRRRYAEYGAPLYLLVDRMTREVTLFSEPGQLGYQAVDGPHPFGTPVALPEPFGITLDTDGL